MSGASRPCGSPSRPIADRPERTFSYLLPAGLGDASARLAAPRPVWTTPGPRVPARWGAPRSRWRGEGRRGDRLGTDADARPARARRGDRDLLPSADRDDARGDAAARPGVAARPRAGSSRPRMRCRRSSVRWSTRRAKSATPASSGTRPRRGRTAWLEHLRRSGAIRAEWSMRPPDVSARRVRIVRLCASRPSRHVARRFSGRSSRRSTAASRRWPNWPKRRMSIGAASWARRGGWRHQAASSSGGGPSSATHSLTGPRACRSDTSLPTSSVPPWTPSRALAAGRRAPARGRGSIGQDATSTSPRSRRRWTRAGRRSCSSRR